MAKKELKKLLTSVAILMLFITNGSANIIRANEEVNNEAGEVVEEVQVEATTEEVSVEEETVPMINTALPIEAALKEAGLSMEESEEPVNEETNETLEEEQPVEETIKEEGTNETPNEEVVEGNNEEPEVMVEEEATEENTLRGADGTTKVKVEWLDDKEHDESVNIYLAENESAPGGAQLTLPTDNKYEMDLEGINLDWVLIASRFDSDNEALLKEYTYTVTETPTDTGKTIVVTLAPTTTLTIFKDWQDNYDERGLRPGSIQVTVKANGTEIEGSPFTIEGSKTDWYWEKKLENLPLLNESGNEIEYTVEELTELESYKSDNGTVTTSNTTLCTTITNTTKPLTTLTIFKDWQDNYDEKGLRPSSIQVTVKANGTEIEGSPFTIEGSKTDWYWEKKLENLPTEDKDGNKINYTVEELTKLDTYDSLNGDVNTSNTTLCTTITNTTKPLTTLTIFKDWQDNYDEKGLRPSSIQVTVKANGTEIEGSPFTIEGSKTDWYWEKKLENLPTEDKDGNKINYTVEELTKLDTYDSLNGDVNTSNTTLCTTITNTTKPLNTSLTIYKKWADNDNQYNSRPEIVIVYVKNEESGEQVGDPITLGEGNNWIHVVENLPKYKDGKEIKYTVEEYVPDFYIKSGGDVEPINTTMMNSTITNTTIPNNTSLTVSKKWEDNENQDGKRPDSIIVKLLANGKVKDRKKVTATDDWTVAFEDLLIYENGEEIIYTVEEEPVDGYDTKIEPTYKNKKDYTGIYDPTDEEPDNDKIEELDQPVSRAFTITNTHEPEKVDVDVEKVWEDDNNRDGLRPASITVALLADGVETGEAKDLSESTSWKASFTGLDKYEDGKEIEYTVKELNVEGYNSTVDGYTVTNTHESEKIQLSVTKVWDDENDKDKMRPASVTVKLLANGKDTGKTVTLNKDNSWKASFADLYKYENGKEISYDVEEVVPNGYTVAKSGDAKAGFTLTNKHEPTPTPTPTPKKPTPGKPVVPYTGDDFNMWMYLALLSGGMLVSLLSAWKLRTNKGTVK